MGFFRQEYCRGLPHLSLVTPALQVDSLPLNHQESPKGPTTVKEEVKVLVTQSCLTLCNFMDHSPPG